MRFPAALAIVALLIPFGADAQEAIATASGEDPPAAVSGADDPSGEEDPGDWARRVLAGRPASSEARHPDASAPGGCQPVGDGRPHGEVWAGVGTRGYREVGGVVTQQLGKCASVTIAVSKTEGPRWRRPR